MNKIVQLCFILLTFAHTLNAQVKITKSDVDYSLIIAHDQVIRTLTFWKDKDSSIYHSVKYDVSDFQETNSKKNLEDEIQYIKKLWEIAEDSICFSLKSFNIGYPLLYADILKNHINAFLASEDWQNYSRKNGKKLEYKLQKQIMLENNVYKPLQDFLKTKNYSITGFETEKHGFVTKENLQKAGFSGEEIIPMPFIVWLKLAHTK